MTWEPIETAPKDGRVIIGWFGGKEPTPYAESVQWQPPFGKDGAWFWTHDADQPVNQPTHWVEMPAPPVSA